MKTTEKIQKLKTRLLPNLIFQSVLVLVVSVLSYSLMTYLVTDVFGVKSVYEAMIYEMIGTLFFLSCVIVPFNVALYRIRAKEVDILSRAIKRVADGDYTTRIPTNKRGKIAPIYAYFNKMCAELESVHIMRTDFINNYSHEFKTPIASINGFASLILEKDIPLNEQRKYLEIIAEESARLSKLATNTILLSKLSSQQIVTDNETYNLSEQLRQCSIILSKKWFEKKIEFSADISEINFNGNKEMMQHLWLNLLDNSIKYTPEGGEISLKAFTQGSCITVKICDTGEGIDEKSLPHLFDPYFQDKQRSSQQGLGLGLAIAKRIVELCDGEISVESKLSEGSTFTVTLPIKSV